MADVKIRKLPDWVVASFKARAEHEGRSLEDELRKLLTDEATRRREALVRDLAAFRRKLRKKYGELPDSTPGIVGGPSAAGLIHL
jgi:plasmid stability protein